MENELYLTEAEMLRIQLFEEEANAGEALARLLIYEKEAYLAQIDPSGKLADYLKQIRLASDKNATAKKKAKELKESIEKRLNIKLEDYVYSEETGLLSKPEQ